MISFERDFYNLMSAYIRMNEDIPWMLEVIDRAREKLTEAHDYQQQMMAETLAAGPDFLVSWPPVMDHINEAVRHDEDPDPGRD